VKSNVIRTAGDRRSDGFYFVNYEKTKYGIREKWASPERWKKIKEYNRKYHSARSQMRRRVK
jgi:hypothetical protein